MTTNIKRKGYDKAHYQKHKKEILSYQKERNRAKSIITKEIKQMEPTEVLDLVGFDGL